MKTILKLTVCFIVGIVLVSKADAQVAFQNLDFESPVGSLTSIYPPGFPTTVRFTNAFPGWTGYVGTNLAEEVRIDGVNISLATLALIRRNVFSPSPAPLIEGQYTAVLQPQQTTYGGPFPVALVPVALGQSSLVPVDSRSLLFKGYTAGTPFTVTLGGVDIPVFALGTFPSYTQYGGDISTFAGSIAELRFTAFPDNYPHSSVFALDSIEFSIQPIPEPACFGLFTLGGLLLGWGFLCKRS